MQRRNRHPSIGLLPVSRQTNTTFNSLHDLGTSYGDKIWVTIGSGKGLVPYGTKPLPGPIMIYHQ